MASNKRFLKAYARFDGSGRIVASSTILRKNKPKVGNWKEVQTYLCCNGVELFYTPDSYPISDPAVTFTCSPSPSGTGNWAPGTADNINELVTLLNETPDTSQYGYYVAQSDGSVKLTVPQAVVDDLCPTGTLSFTIQPD